MKQSWIAAALLAALFAWSGLTMLQVSAQQENDADPQSDSAPAVDEAQIREWADGLKSDDPMTRIRARRHLRDAGEAALPVLNEIIADADPLQAMSLRSLCMQIESDVRFEKLRGMDLDTFFDDWDIVLPGHDWSELDESMRDLEKRLEEMRKNIRIERSRDSDNDFSSVQSLSFSFDGNGMSQTQISNGNRITFRKDQNGEIRFEVQKAGESEATAYEAPGWKEFSESYPEIVKEYGLTEKGIGSAHSIQIEVFQNGGMARPRYQREEETEPRATIKPLGVRLTPASELVTAHLDLKTPAYVVEDVEDDSFALQLGLRRWDMLVKVDGKPFETGADPRAALQALRDKGKGGVTILRKGEELTLSLDK